MLIDGAGRPQLGTTDTRIRVLGAVLAGAALLVALQIFATRSGFQGPLHSLISDYVATPKSASVPWAGLVLAMVGLSNRRRIISIGAAIGIDLVFLIGRALAGSSTVTVGNGPTIVLTALAIVAAFRWSGTERTTALHGVALGALLVLATKVGDAWLHLTVLAHSTVLDEYAMIADRALGDPSWLVGRLVEATGPVGHGVLHWVYIELPVAAMVVACYQLRNVTTTGWPRHYLVRTFLVLGVVGPVIYLLFPVVGPAFAFGSDGMGFQVGDYWPRVLPPSLDPSAIPFDKFTPRNCMPSMHTAWALAVFIHSRRGPRWLRWGGAFWLVCTLIATLGFGYHYGVDLVVGAVLCLTVESALRDPERGWGAFRVRLLVAGAALMAGLLLCYRYLATAMARWPEFAGPLIVLAFAGFAVAFYATFFARPDSALGRWGCREDSVPLPVR